MINKIAKKKKISRDKTELQRSAAPLAAFCGRDRDHTQKIKIVRILTKAPHTLGESRWNNNNSHVGFGRLYASITPVTKTHL